MPKSRPFLSNDQALGNDPMPSRKACGYLLVRALEMNGKGGAEGGVGTGESLNLLRGKKTWQNRDNHQRSRGSFV